MTWQGHLASKWQSGDLSLGLTPKSKSSCVGVCPTARRGKGPDTALLMSPPGAESADALAERLQAKVAAGCLAWSRGVVPGPQEPPS